MVRNGFLPSDIYHPTPSLGRELKRKFTVKLIYYNILRYLLINWKAHCSKLLAPLPCHSYRHKHGRFLTITFAPWRTCTTSFLSWRRRSTAVLANESVISSLTVENVHLAHGQRQYPSASRVSSTYIQGRSRKSILIMLLAKFVFFKAEEGKQK